MWVGLSNPHFVLSMGSQGKWSTARITEILKSYDKLGILPRNNPFYEGDTNWRANNLNYEYTYDEILEKTKIEINILYFAEKYASVMTDDGITLVKLRNYQKKNNLGTIKYDEAFRPESQNIDPLMRYRLNGGVVY